MLLSITCIFKNHFSAKFPVGCKAGLGFLRSLPMEFPSRKTFFHLQPRSSLAKGFLLAGPISPLGAASAGRGRPARKQQRGGCPSALGTGASSAPGFSRPCPGSDLHCPVPRRPHTQWQRFLSCLRKGQGFEGIPWVLQNAGYSPFHSVSPIEPGSPGSGHPRQLSLTAWLGILCLPGSHSQAWPGYPLPHRPSSLSDASPFSPTVRGEPAGIISL